jgi:hypothetical protein
MQAERAKVLMIAGSGRSGSTMLDNILGQIEGFSSVGELRFIWERGMLHDRLCGCGLAFHDCPFWQAVMIASFSARPDAEDLIVLQRRGTRMRHIPRMFGTGDALMRSMGTCPALTQDLYLGIRSVAGCRVVVDSSKLPTYAHLVSRLPGIDLYVVHLIRDPRATAFSWSRKKAAPDRKDGSMQRQGAAKAAALWAVWNWTARKLFFPNGERYMLVRYEDLVASPKEVVGRIAEFVGEGDAGLPFRDDRTVNLSPTHSVAGNPSRFITGQVELKFDDAWMSRMKSSNRILVTAICLPLLRGFGYAIRSRARGA